MQLVISESSATPSVRPTWTRFILTLLVGAGCLIGAVAALALPSFPS